MRHPLLRPHSATARPSPPIEEPRSVEVAKPTAYQGCRGCKAIRAALTKFLYGRVPRKF